MFRKELRISPLCKIKAEWFETLTKITFHLFYLILTRLWYISEFNPKKNYKLKKHIRSCLLQEFQKDGTPTEAFKNIYAVYTYIVNGWKRRLRCRMFKASVFKKNYSKWRISFTALVIKKWETHTKKHRSHWLMFTRIWKISSITN